MSIEYGLVHIYLFIFSAQFDLPYSILSQVTLSRFIVNLKFVPKKKKKKKRFLIAKLLRILYYVRRLSVSYRMNVRTSQKCSA